MYLASAGVSTKINEAASASGNPFVMAAASVAGPVLQALGVGHDKSNVDFSRAFDALQPGEYITSELPLADKKGGASIEKATNPSPGISPLSAPSGSQVGSQLPAGNFIAGGRVDAWVMPVIIGVTGAFLLSAFMSRKGR